MTDIVRQTKGERTEMSDLTKHLNQEQLVDYRYGDAADSGAVEQHLHECAECAAAYAKLLGVLAIVDAAPVPEPGPGYEARLWWKLSPRLDRPNRSWLDVSAWREWLANAWAEPRRLAPLGAVAVLLIAAFFVGRISLSPNVPAVAPPVVSERTPGQVRERILLVAVGDHLDRAQTVLLEISNAEADATGKTARDKEVDISQVQATAEELLSQNRIYRQTAQHTGDNSVASVLDELEPVLLEIAHSPSRVTAGQLDELQKSIEARGLILKVRVMDSTVRNREKAIRPRNSNSGS
jgi:hypothetical protein